MAQHLQSEFDAGVLRLTLNRPRKGNLVTPRMMLDLAARVRGAGDDKGLKAVLVEGRGPNFCVGREPKPIPGGSARTAFEAHQSVMGPILAVYEAFRRCPAPVIAVARGQVRGFGCGIVGAADLALADAQATFALPEMAHGIPPTLVISALAHVNRKSLADLVYSGEAVDARTALAIGLVGRIVENGPAGDAAHRLISTLRGYDVPAIRLVKQFLGKPGLLDPDSLSELAGYSLATAFTRPRERSNL